MTPELIKELKQMDEYSNQAKFLARNKIDTEELLLNFEKSAYDKIAALKSEIENLWKKHKRAKTNTEKTFIEDKIIEISKLITPIFEELRYCQNILKRVEKIKEFELHQQLEEEKQKLEKDVEKENV